jgi:hypothetical protein
MNSVPPFKSPLHRFSPCETACLHRRAVVAVIAIVPHILCRPTTLNTMASSAGPPQAAAARTPKRSRKSAVFYELGQIGRRTGATVPAHAARVRTHTHTHTHIVSMETLTTCRCRVCRTSTAWSLSSRIFPTRTRTSRRHHHRQRRRRRRRRRHHSPLRCVVNPSVYLPPRQSRLRRRQAARLLGARRIWRPSAIRRRPRRLLDRCRPSRSLSLTRIADGPRPGRAWLLWVARVRQRAKRTPSTP